MPARHPRLRTPQPAGPTAAPVARALVLGLCAFALTACAAEDVLQDPTESPLALSLHALSGTCGGQANKNPFAEIKSFDMRVKASDLESAWKPDSGLSIVSKAVTVPEVPAGSGREITLIGMDGAGAKGWFARKSGVKVVKNTTTDLEMTLMTLDAFTCIGLEAGKISNVVFPAVTRIAGGKILITGGFAVASKDAKKYTLEQPMDSAYIFDANTGVLRELQGQSRLIEKRGGHSAVYLPNSNRVLIVGGAREMTSALDKSGPPEWQPSKAVNVTYEIFDVTTEKFIRPHDKSIEQVVKRVFPNLMALAGDWVVSLGGARWPASLTADPASYQNSDLYNPSAAFDPNPKPDPKYKDIGAGAFVKHGAALPLTEVRGGAALAFIGTTAQGVSKYLIWGGGSNPAEVFTESTSPGDGTFDNTYVIEGDILKEKGDLYFPAVVSLGATAGNDGRFLSIGGIRHNGTAWLPPSANDVYLLVLTTPDKGKKRINTIRVSGLNAGVFMHQATLTDDNHVLVSGGFTGYGAPTTFTMRVFDVSGIQDQANMDAVLAGTKKLSLTEPATAKQWIKRGGHASVRLNNDCVLAYGGVTDFADLASTSEVAADIYCPKHLDPTQ